MFPICIPRDGVKGDPWHSWLLPTVNKSCSVGSFCVGNGAADSGRDPGA